MPEHFDLVVIGAGPAGEKAATQAAWFGKRVAVVERSAAPGGEAVSAAGIPTKTLRETALYITGFRQRDVYGVGLSLDARLKLDRLAQRRGEVVDAMTAAVREHLEDMGVLLIQGEARLGADRTVLVDGRKLAAEVILIATGSHARHPKSIPFDDAAVHDSNGILDLERLPRSILVIGGGAVGCEYASIFAALDVQVTLIEMSDRLLHFMDAEISELLAAAFVKHGMRVVTGCGVARLERRDDVLEAVLGNGETVRAEHVLFAGGRGGNVAGLGLEAAGVEVDAHGHIRVDAKFQTTAPGIYAAGDVIGPPALSSVSMEQGRVAACNAFGIHFKDHVDPLPPMCVYTIPEVAMVGQVESEGVEVGRGWFTGNTRARICGITDGLVKLVFDRADKTVLGVHIMGEAAAEMIHLGQLVVSQRLPLDYFIHTTFAVPTFSEAFKYAAYDGLQRLQGRVPAAAR